MDVDVSLQTMRARRQAIEPQDVGLQPRPAAGRRGPRVRGLTQTEVDLLMNRAIGTYQKVESGALRPTSSYLLELARVLQFTDSEYIYAHLEYFGTEPSQPLRPDADLDVPSSWQRVLDGQREMSYVIDFRYDLRLYNSAFAAMFPRGEPPANTTAWMLLDDDARDLCLTDWETAWAPLVISSFRASLAAHPDDPVLKGIHERILNDPRVRPLYEMSDRAKIHPDGDRRPLRHAVLGQGYVTMIVAHLASLTSARHMTILFDPS
ncbi:XRE family transcriptional regulator [Streptomyces sp. NPDC058301]|uniref:helix-turn-helix domain-containing protein n=1 Tax=Streptomyces sp. NPDC058301 TaxID=3346436 RepID=UPI0036F1497C